MGVIESGEKLWIGIEVKGRDQTYQIFSSSVSQAPRRPEQTLQAY